ncbi:hypothetical protein CDL12_05519 [Handroanthus impetiginosus]|uniref:WW domain-containing protein n=1 Tax=Handroanthus impetiginosus TaxID=429701 RepID=A0A2G9HW80_9LAMI|nr:hypothetical protein CDL12_19296 [Handroanthus impetiginosus]PIN21781.1 hypothetical protein CDL12_05519 [Handroanthus impetiginosus]
MISLQTSKEILAQESLSKKRKWDDDPREEILEKIKTFDPQTETSSPSEWQQCLDIKSGQIYFYNKRTNKRAMSDPRSSLAPHKKTPMSLELQLNLPSQSLGKNDSCTTLIHSRDNFVNSNPIRDVTGLTRSPSWLTFEGEQQEMVTAVCKKCFMLVMMCKSSPTCPNCKFNQQVDG